MLGPRLSMAELSHSCAALTLHCIPSSPGCVPSQRTFSWHTGLVGSPPSSGVGLCCGHAVVLQFRCGGCFPLNPKQALGLENLPGSSEGSSLLPAKHCAHPVPPFSQLASASTVPPPGRPRRGDTAATAPACSIPQIPCHGHQ